MRFYVWILFVLVVSVVIGAIKQFAATSPGRKMARGFRRLGVLRGRTISEIVRVVGDPTSYRTLSDGKELIQWQAADYLISLRFDGDICEGVAHESSVQI